MEEAVNLLKFYFCPLSLSQMTMDFFVECYQPLINYKWCLSCSACEVISKGKREIINIITMNS